MMRRGVQLNLLLATAMCASGVFGQTWAVQTSGASVPLRGISAVSANVAWASGAKGTYLRTVDGGVSWKASSVPGAADLDFRDVQAFDERTALLLSSGAGNLSRIYRTTDGGAHWTLTATNLSPKGFWDAFAFWDPSHGMAVGDPVDGRFDLQVTSDGGVTWQRVKGPPAQKDEGAFAASGTCLFTRGAREVWLGTGGPLGGRVLHSVDAGQTWTAAATPIRKGESSTGIFSLAFSGGARGVAVGGDYLKLKETDGTIVLTSDGGKSWTAGTSPSGYVSAVTYLPGQKMWIATGTAGSVVSDNDGRTWRQFDSASWNAMSFTPEGTGWAVGPSGTIAKFVPAR